MKHPKVIQCKCPFCGKLSEVVVEAHDWIEYKTHNKSVQSCFPYLSSDDRELLISGVCSDCWNKYMNSDE